MTIIDIRLSLKGSLDNDQHLTENTVYTLLTFQVLEIITFNQPMKSQDFPQHWQEKREGVWVDLDLEGDKVNNKLKL